MKFKARKNQEKSNYQSAEIIKATIGNPAKMLKMFTKDLYKHPLQTAIQEYINNAKDAHIMVGKDTSTIEITAPTVANQNVIIRDYGPGLSLEDVKDIFAKIAVSNKDHSDLFNGGFGIGSKSWFAVNTSFYVISVYNKEKTYYTVNFDESKGIFISVDHKEKTKEANGVEIQLPLANKNQIKDAHKAIFRAVEFWEHHPKLINCDFKFKKPIFKTKDYTVTKLINDRYDNNGRTIVTLGGTPYSIKEMPSIYDIEDLMAYFDVAIHFEVGEMNLKNSQEVGPDREAFALACNKMILNKAKKVHKEILDELVKKLDELDSKKEICKFLSNPELSELFYSDGYKKDIGGVTVVFRPESYNNNPDEIGIKILGEAVDYLNVGNNITQASTYLERVKTVSHIFLQDIEMKDYEIRAAIGAVLPSVSRPSKYRKVSNGAYIYNSEYFTDKEVKELEKYFTIVKMSEIDYKIEKKASRKIPDDTLNIIKLNWKDTYYSNIKIKFDDLDEDIEFTTNKALEKSKTATWNTIRKAKKVLNKNIIIVSQTNANILEEKGFTELKLSSLKKEIKDEEKAIEERKKEEFLNSDYSTFYKYIDFVKYMEQEFCDWNDDFDYLMECLSSIKVTNTTLKKILKLNLPNSSEMYRIRYDYAEIAKEAKIKQDKTYITFFKKIEKNYPALHTLLKDYSRDEDFYPEIEALFKRVKK